MRFLVDESSGRAVVEFLKADGHDVLSVTDAMLSANDDTILQRAYEEQRIVITNDKDFGDLVFRGGYPHHGVVLMRLQDETASNRVNTITRLLNQYGKHLPNRFVVVTEDRVRFRPKI
ncbi:MAG: DUF5615 family PIN-like protein [Anaerolineae bacterium]|nr:DUF5615 family PIN-like protein [Anaerolineae bacterium]MCO5192853.1 DUF5615 family PIN-like protein [Anaerolineae bacterium]